MPKKSRTVIRVSHVTPSQAARYSGVAQPNIIRRMMSGALPFIEELGVRMISADDCRRLKRERLRFERRTK
jgi:hypothetical protein